MRLLPWFLVTLLTVAAACRRDDGDQAAKSEPEAAAAPKNPAQRFRRARPRMPAPGSAAAAGETAPVPQAPAEGSEAGAAGPPAEPAEKSLRQLRDEHIRSLSDQMRRQVMEKAGQPIPEPRAQSPIRTDGRIDMEKMRAMEDALRKRTAEKRKRGWLPEPKAAKQPAGGQPGREPTAPAPAAP